MTQTEPQGPEFVDEDPAQGAGTGLPGFAEPQVARVPQGPEFVDGPAQDVELEQPVGSQPQAASASPRSVRPLARFSRAAMAVVSAVTVLAILAILAGIKLPREKAEVRQQERAALRPPASTPTAANAVDQEQASAPQTSPVGPGPAPSGTRRVAGPDCGGSGTTACPMKHLPNGHLLNPLFWEEPRYYSGQDPLLPDDADMGVCPVCKGTLWAKCNLCAGTGQVPEGTQPSANQSGGAAATPTVDPRELLKTLGVDAEEQ